jgi:DNA-binding NarL/FixJ family response regulator
MVTTRTTQVRVELHTEDPVSRAGLAACLERFPDLATDGSEDAEVALVMASTVDEQTTMLVRRIQRSGTSRVVLVVGRVDDEGLFAAVEAGVTAILRREEATADVLRDTIRRARQGDGSLPADLLGRLMRQVTQLQDHVLGPQGMRFSGLSDREVKVLGLVAEGLSTAEVAVELAYSERTIKNVVHGVTTRLGLRNRTHAVAWALRQGLI